MSSTLKFYHPAEPFGFCSNFSRHRVRIYNADWMTSEHAFQSRKTTDPSVQQAILRASTPAKAAVLGRTCQLRPDWDNPMSGPLVLVPHVRVKDYIMYEVVRAKFQQNADIQRQLLDTGDAILVEAALHDPYWGAGCSHTGQNKLGQILMIVRDELRRSV